MGLPNDGPCADWATRNDLELCPGCEPDAEIEPAILEDAIDTASFVLYELSGRQYSGLCTSTVRPCRTGSGWLLPDWWSGSWEPSWGQCGCGAGTSSACGCDALEEISLGVFPVRAISSVKVDGVTLASTKYRIDNYKWLVRIDGEAWPSSQDLSLASTEDNTFEVTFTYGTAIPTAGKRAASRLACELAKAYSGRKCKLPERVQSIDRQGVSMTLVDPFDFLEKGKTGIYEVDMFLSAVNRKGRTSQAAVVSPDRGPVTRKVGT